TREEFEAWVNRLPKAHQQARGFFTVIRRGADKALYILPYNQAYEHDLQGASRLLERPPRSRRMNRLRSSCACAQKRSSPTTTTPAISRGCSLTRPSTLPSGLTKPTTTSCSAT